MTLVRPIPLLAAGVLAVVALSGCSSSSTPATPTPQPTIPSTAHYSDAAFHYSFRYPANWRVLQSLSQGSSVLTITIPHSHATVQVATGFARIPLSRLPVGRKVRAGGRTTSYQRVRVAGRSAVEADVVTAAGLRQITTRVNGPRYGYTITVVTPDPPLEGRTLDGYRQIVRTFRIS